MDFPETISPLSSDGTLVVEIGWDLGGCFDLNVDFEAMSITFAVLRRVFSDAPDRFRPRSTKISKGIS